MNIRKLNIFYQTATTLNMTAAAKILYISQPSVSQAIKEIEEEIGTPLFERIGKKLYLTYEGEIFLGCVRRMLNLYEDTHIKINNLINNKKGKIKIGASTTIGLYILPSLVKSFLKDYGDIEISVTIESTSTIEKLILENKIDFAFIEGTVLSDEIRKETLWQDEMIFISPKDSPLSKETIVDGNLLKNQKLIMREQGSGTRETIEAYLFENDIDYTIFMELKENEAIKKYVEAGIGIGCMSKLCIENTLDESTFHTFCLDKGKIKRDLYFIIHKDKFITSSMGEFINFVHVQTSKT
nr:LysR family transcriptional regulator [uncultured Niameybacter sp.]